MSKMTIEEAIEFLELEKESTKTLWDNVNHEGGREYFEKSLEVLNTAIKALKEQLMRDATEEERKSVKDYIESISKPTGVQFETQPCEDAVRREAVETFKEELIDKLAYTGYTEEYKDEIIDIINQMPSIIPIKKGKWLDDCGGVKCSCCGYRIDDDHYAKAYCTNCGAKMSGGREE